MTNVTLTLYLTTTIIRNPLMRLYSSYAARIIAAECPDSAFDDTVLRYRELADMHEQLMLADRSTFEAASQFDAVRKIESLTHRTKKNPTPLYPMPKEFDRFPSTLRRSSIAFAFGQVSSYFTQLKKAEDAETEGKAVPFPSAPTVGRIYPVLYSNVQYEKLTDYTYRIKVFYENTWKWAIVHLCLGDVDYIARHCADRTLLCPMLRKKGKRWYLVFSFEAEVTLTNVPILNQIVVSADLGINHACTCVVMKADGTVLHREVFDLGREKARLDASLSKIRRASKHGAKHLPCLWAAAKGINDDISVKTAQFLLDVAKKYGATVIVMEHLDLQGKKRGSRRWRLHHWRAQYVQKLVEHKAHHAGIRISRVSARNSSRLAYDGSGEVVRDSDNYSMCTFANGKRCHCDISAAMNLAARYIVRTIMASLPEGVQKELNLFRENELRKKSLLNQKGQISRTIEAKEADNASEDAKDKSATATIHSDFSHRTTCTYDTLRRLHAALRLRRLKAKDAEAALRSKHRAETVPFTETGSERCPNVSQAIP